FLQLPEPAGPAAPCPSPPTVATPEPSRFSLGAWLGVGLLSLQMLQHGRVPPTPGLLGICCPSG
ncbi:Hypothetical predicted protein, partial [Marmota monax]